jgi:hypothetical protein
MIWKKFIKIMSKQLSYVSETRLDNQSAYSVHTLKMVNSFCKNNIKTKLYLPNLNKKINLNRIKKNFNLQSNKNFEIINVNNKNIYNFIDRLIFGYKTASLINKESVILTRSLITSFFLCIHKKKHILEIHNELRGFTYFIFIFLNFINSPYINKIVFISRSLSSYFKINKNKFIILHDGADISNFNYQPKRTTKIKNITYVGSFYKGRGIELIFKIAKFFPQLNFKLYGNNKNNHLKKTKNLKLFNYQPHYKIPSILKKSDILLMPFEKNVYVNSKNLNTAKYMSPLKMFEYLASGRIIISSNIKVLKEVLNKKNSIIVKKNNLSSWVEEIQKLIQYKYNIKNICKNARITANKYSWDKRAETIINI